MAINKKKYSVSKLDMRPMVKRIFEDTFDRETSDELQPDINMDRLKTIGAKFDITNDEPTAENRKYKAFNAIKQYLDEAILISQDYAELGKVSKYLIALKEKMIEAIELLGNDSEETEIEGE